MNFRFLKAMSLLVLTSIPAISQASFLSELEGSYTVGGEKCVFENFTSLTGKSVIAVTEDGVVVNIGVIIGLLETQIPYKFIEGSGSVTRKTDRGDIIPLRTTIKTEWATDDVNRTSTLIEYEGIVRLKKTGTYKLTEVEDGKVVLEMTDQGIPDIECILSRD